MKSCNKILLSCCIVVFSTSCVSQKKYAALQKELEEEKLNNAKATTSLTHVNKEVTNLEQQLKDCKEQRDKQLEQVGDLTVLSQSANDNIKETLTQLEKKDKYIKLLQEAKSKADSINLVLSINLKKELKDGIDDKDIEIKVDKTVVMINLSDSMVYQSGSHNLTKRAKEVLQKIATIVKDRPDLEIMVEGYTDDVPISNNCLQDNWDLSVKRATSVVRVLQNEYKVNPNRLIAAGRGEYNTLVPNDSPTNRKINRRTRIIIMPKLNQFYDLLEPTDTPTADE